MMAFKGTMSPEAIPCPDAGGLESKYILVTVKVVYSTPDSEVDSGPIQEQRIMGKLSLNYECHRFIHDFQRDFRCLQLAIVV
jgi:hypothetical protein